MLGFKVGDRVRLTGSNFKHYLPESVWLSEREGVLVTQIDYCEDSSPKVWIITNFGDSESFFVIPGWDVELFEEEESLPYLNFEVSEECEGVDYYQGDLVMQLIEEADLSFALGNVVKYVSRAGKKGDVLEDLFKARWYLERAINHLDGEPNDGLKRAMSRLADEVV